MYWYNTLIFDPNNFRKNDVNILNFVNCEKSLFFSV